MLSFVRSRAPQALKRVHRRWYSKPIEVPAPLPKKRGWNRVAAYSTLGLAAISATAVYIDEGLNRSATFWWNILPIYGHYRFVQWKTTGKSDQEIADAFKQLHVHYSPQVVTQLTTQVRALVLRMRGYYLKNAQIFSGLPGSFIPIEYLSWCKEMQDEVPSEFRAGEVEQLVEKELGRPLGEVFEYFNPVPIGAASIGQVHYARLIGGREVAIKIQFPGIERRFRADMSTLLMFCRLAMPQHVPSLVAIEKMFLKEFDYQAEASNLGIVAKNLRPHYGDRVVVPEPLPDLCSRTMLVMDFLSGKNIRKVLEANLAEMAAKEGKPVAQFRVEMEKKFEKGELKLETPETLRRKMKVYTALARPPLRKIADGFVNLLISSHNWTLGFVREPLPYRHTKLPPNYGEILQLLFEVHAHQIFVDGEFNGDPHAGNILLLDFGQLNYFALPDRLTYAKLIRALATGDKSSILKISAEMGNSTKYMNPDVAWRLSAFWNDRMTDDVLQGLNISDFLDWCEATDPIVHINEAFVAPARVSLLLRGIGYSFGVTTRTSQLWLAHAERLLNEHSVK